MKKTRQRGFTLVETLAACTLLILLIGVFGTVTIFTLKLSLREQEAAQTALLADTLVNRVDALLREATELRYGTDDQGVYIEYVSPAYPGHGEDQRQLARLQSREGRLCVAYAGQEKPAGYLLPDNGGAALTAGLEVLRDDGNSLRLRITLSGTKHHTSCSRAFTVLLPNC